MLLLCMAVFCSDCGMSRRDGRTAEESKAQESSVSSGSGETENQSSGRDGSGNVSSESMDGNKAGRGRETERAQRAESGEESLQLLSVRFIPMNPSVDSDDEQFSIDLRYPEYIVTDQAGSENMDPEHPKLNAALAEHNGAIREAVEELGMEAREMLLQEQRNGRERLSAYCVDEAKVLRADTRILSVRDDISVYLYEELQTERIGTTYDAKTGEELLLEDVLQDGTDALCAAAETILREVYEESGGELPFGRDLTEKIKSCMPGGPEEEALSWTLGYTGLTLYFREKVLMEQPRPLTAFLSFARFRGLIREEYTVTPENFIETLEQGSSYLLPGRTAGPALWIENTSRHGTEELSGESAMTTVWLANNDYSMEYMRFPDEYYLVHAGNKNYLYIHVPVGDVSFSTDIFDLNRKDFSLQKPENIGAAFDTSSYYPIDPAHMYMTTFDERMDDRPVTDEYSIGADGLPEALSQRSGESAPPADDEAGLFEELAGTWRVDGQEGTAYFVFEETGYYTAFYASGAVEYEGYMVQNAEALYELEIDMLSEEGERINSFVLTSPDEFWLTAAAGGDSIRVVRDRR